MTLSLNGGVQNEALVWRDWIWDDFKELFLLRKSNLLTTSPTWRSSGRQLKSDECYRCGSGALQPLEGFVALVAANSQLAHLSVVAGIEFQVWWPQPTTRSSGQALSWDKCLHRTSLSCPKHNWKRWTYLCCCDFVSTSLQSAVCPITVLWLWFQLGAAAAEEYLVAAGESFKSAPQPPAQKVSRAEAQPEPQRLRKGSRAWSRCNASQSPGAAGIPCAPAMAVTPLLAPLSALTLACRCCWEPQSARGERRHRRERCEGTFGREPTPGSTAACWALPGGCTLRPDEAAAARGALNPVQTGTVPGCGAAARHHEPDGDGVPPPGAVPLLQGR